MRAGRAAWLLVVAATLAGSALAQQAPSREQEQIRRLRQQLQQLQQELAGARQAEAAARVEAARQIAEVQAEAARARRGGRAQAERITVLQAELTAQREVAGATAATLARRDEELGAVRQSLAAARAEIARRAEALREGERLSAELLVRFREQNAALELCTRNNQELRQVSLDLLERWRRHDWRDVLAAREPFVQSRRVAIENLVQDYEDRIERAWLAPAAVPAQGR